MASKFEDAVLAYKYSSPNLSFLEKVILNTFWDNFVYIYPTWLAPNLISLTGGSCCLISYFVNWYVSPNGLGTGEPTLIYALFSFLLFAYQTLDGTDGKQARRTKSGSALGELMDHGIDAVVTGFAAFVVADSLGFGIDRLIPWICIFGGQMAFYMSNLTLLHRGKQTFFPIDIMELQWVMIITMAISGVFGTKFWSEFLIPIPKFLSPYCQKLNQDVFLVPDIFPEGYVQARFIIAVGAAGGTVQNFVLYTFMAAAPYFAQEKPAHIVKGVPGTGLLQLFKQIVIICIYGGLSFSSFYFISQMKDSKVRHDSFRALLFGCCYAFGDLMDRLLVMRVTHLSLPFFSPTLICMSFFSIGFGLQSLGKVPTMAIPWYILVAILCFVCHLTFFVWVSKKLAKVLGISVFTIKKIAVQ